MRSPNHYYYTGGSSLFKVFRLGIRLAIFVVAPLVLLSLGRTEGLFPRLKTPIKSINREYIKSISSRAIEDIEKKNFDSAITKSRTLLEEVFCYAIEKKGDTPTTSGNMSELYKQVKGHYNMHTDPNVDRRINTLLSGLEKIVSSISEMRNKDSDAHGVGSARINIEEHHARLFVNSAVLMADFILSIEQNSNQ